MRGAGSVYPSPLGSRGSAQGILDLSNLRRSGTEEKVEDEVLGVLCGGRDIARERDEMKRLIWALNEGHLESQMWYKD